MVRPTRHPRTGVYRIRQPIPARLKDVTQRRYGVRREFVESLSTKDWREAKERAAPVIEKFTAWLRAAEAEHTGQAVHLTDREVETLCGRWLAKETQARREYVGGTADDFDEARDYLGDIARGLLEDEDQEYLGNPAKDAVEAMRSDIDPLLAAQGLAIDTDSWERLSARLVVTQWHFMRDLAERARSGRWVPSIGPEDFPTAAIGSDKAPEAVCTFDTLLAGWALDHGYKIGTKPIPRGLYDRQRTLERLAIFLDHRDANQVTKADVVRWKEEALGRGLKAPTVRNDISEMSAVWSWGIRNGKLRADVNPFEGTLPPKAPKRSREPRAFTDAEAAMILEAARKQQGCLRWLPWVLCLTGARLNEITQSDKEDVTTQDGVPVIRIHDAGEGRSIKNVDSRRTVPLHPALIAEGFLSYVSTLPAGSALFPDVRPDAVFGQRSVIAGRKVARWLRSDLDIVDPLISPNHSWRHWFISACRSVVMPVEVRSAITGHSAKMDESAGYGDRMGTFVQVVAGYLAKVPCPVPPAAVPRSERP
jgi:integrase